MKAIDIKPILHTIEHTDRLVANQGYTYNDVRLTYNSDVYYGGLYGEDNESPKVLIEVSIPNMEYIEKTDRLLSGTWTFNQTGISFNQTGLEFGGLYKNDGIAPIWG